MKENGSLICGDVIEKTDILSVKYRIVESVNKVLDVFVSGGKRF